jgi:antitoxin FitA
VCTGSISSLAPAQNDKYALLRYNGAVATIQVREIPEDLYEVLRRRARRSGQSLQAYMHDQVVALAQQTTKQEAVEEIEAVLARVTSEEPDTASVLDDLAAERR